MVNWYKELSSIDVSEFVYEKNGLSYLSWMWAWHLLKTRYPLSYATVHETEDGSLVWKDPSGCHVKTSITIVWEEDGELKEHTATEYLPCMDFRNKAIPYDNVDSMQINKTIQRSLTKCIARLGLGDYLYTKEDAPEVVVKLQEINETNMKLAKKLSEGADEVKAKLIGETIEKFEPSRNPKKVKDVETAEALYEALMGLRKVK